MFYNSPQNALSLFIAHTSLVLALSQFQSIGFHSLSHLHVNTVSEVFAVQYHDLCSVPNPTPVLCAILPRLSALVSHRRLEHSTLQHQFSSMEEEGFNRKSANHRRRTAAPRKGHHLELYNTSGLFHLWTGYGESKDPQVTDQ